MGLEEIILEIEKYKDVPNHKSATEVFGVLNTTRYNELKHIADLDWFQHYIEYQLDNLVNCNVNYRNTTAFVKDYNVIIPAILFNLKKVEL